MTKASACKVAVHVELGQTDEPMNIRQLGARIGWDHTTIYAALRDLEMHRLVKRIKISPSVGGRSKQVMFAWELI